MIKITACMDKKQLQQKLTWDQFQGQADQTSPYLAYTYWNVGYNISNQRGIVINISIRVSPKSWVKQPANTKQLLKHERGHFNICKILALRFLNRINGCCFGLDYQAAIAELFGMLHSQALELEEKYDMETCHYKNAEAQEKWNVFLKSTLISLINKLK